MKTGKMMIFCLTVLSLMGFNSMVFAQTSPPMHVEGGSWHAAPQPQAAMPFEAKSVLDPIMDSVLYGTQWKQRLQVLSGTNKNLIGVVVKQEIYNGCRDRIQIFISDLQDRGYRFYVETVSGGKPADLRERLRSRLNDGLAGTFLIGSGDPLVAWYEMPDDFWNNRAEFPLDIYFANFTGEWIDTDGNGIFDKHTGNDDIQIWISRISFGTFGNEVADINYYLDKNHYWTRNWSIYKKTKGSASAYIDDDWTGMGETLKRNLGAIYPGVDVFNDPVATTATDYLRKLQQSYDFITPWAHGNINIHAFKSSSVWGSVDAEDIINVAPKPFFYNLYSCEVANYTGLYRKSDDYFQQYIGGAYLLSGNSLVVIGSTKIGSMPNTDAFYRALAEGKNFGDAFVEWWGNSGFTDDLSRRQWIWGMVILGDATWSPNGVPSSLPSMNISANIVEMTVEKSQDVTVTVTDEKGIAISGAVVSLNGAGINLSATADSKGKVTFKKVSPADSGQIIVVAEKDGYADATFSITVKPAEFNVGVMIYGFGKNKTVRVNIRNSATNKSVSGAQVIFSGVVNQIMTTLSNGQVSLRFNGTGHLKIQITKKGYTDWIKIYSIN